MGLCTLIALAFLGSVRFAGLKRALCSFLHGFHHRLGISGTLWQRLAGILSANMRAQLTLWALLCLRARFVFRSPSGSVCVCPEQRRAAVSSLTARMPKLSRRKLVRWSH